MGRKPIGYTYRIAIGIEEIDIYYKYLSANYSGLPYPPDNLHKMEGVSEIEGYTIYFYDVNNELIDKYVIKKRETKYRRW